MYTLDELNKLCDDPNLDYNDFSLMIENQYFVPAYYGYLWKSYKKNPEENVKYNNMQNVLEKIFKRTALRISGLENHPKKEKIYSFAWNEKHSGYSTGYNDVFVFLYNLSELFR